MESVFITLLNLSITASYLIIAVILLRFALFKAPKWINCLLWAVVGIRLVLPFSLESVLSLVPSAEPIPEDIALSPTPQVNTGIDYVNNTINPIISTSFAPEPTASANPLQIIIPIAAIVWLCGIVAMLSWGMISYFCLKRRVAPSLYLRDNIYLCDNISSPFILGIFSPRVYLPSSISESEAELVIAHERSHLARRDHIFKPLGFLILSVYWFDPLCWIAYILFCRDIEKACDERVISKMAIDSRREYSTTLLSFSARRFGVSACPLAFGEIGVKSRIKSVLNYKKPAFWIIVVSLVAAIAVAVAFLTMPPSDLADDIVQDLGNTDTDKMTENQKELYQKYPQYFGLDASSGLDVYVWQLAEHNYNFGLLEHSDEPRHWLDEELVEMRSVGAYDMRQILDTYGIPRDKINIIPWQNPLSSYLGDIWINIEGEDSAKEYEDYISSIEYMLFDKEYLSPDNLMTYDMPLYDTAVFDIDGDGHDETCALAHGRTSGVFTFTFYAYDTLSGNQKYFTTFYSRWYDLSFKLCDDGVVRVQGIDQADPPETHLFDISVAEGNVHLTENGKPIGEILNTYIIP